MPVRALTQWQIGKESNWGTAVVATARLMGVTPKSSIAPDNVSKVYEDVRNGFQGSGLAGLEQIGAKGDLEMVATFEDLPYLLDNALGEATPSGTASPYTRAYAMPVGSITAPRIWTIIYGNSQTGGGVYTVPGALITSLKFSAKTGGPMMVTAGIVGKQITTAGVLASLSDRAVTPIMGQPWAVKMDAWGGTMGATALSATVVGFDVTVDLKREVVRSVDALAPDSWETTGAAVKLDLTLRFNATTKAEVDAIVAQSAVIQKQIALSQTAGVQKCEFQFAGTLTGQPKIYDDQNGVLTTSLSYDGTYHTTFANSFKMNVLNSVAALV